MERRRENIIKKETHSTSGFFTPKYLTSNEIKSLRTGSIVVGFEPNDLQIFRILKKALTTGPEAFERRQKPELVTFSRESEFDLENRMVPPSDYGEPFTDIHDFSSFFGSRK